MLNLFNGNHSEVTEEKKIKPIHNWRSYARSCYAIIRVQAYKHTVESRAPSLKTIENTATEPSLDDRKVMNM